MSHIWQEDERKTRLWVDVAATALQPRLLKEKDEVKGVPLFSPQSDSKTWDSGAEGQRAFSTFAFHMAAFSKQTSPFCVL